MTNIKELKALTVKDLRQLAGEHAIKNRSRLAKEQLIQALQGAIGNRQSDGKPAVEPTAKNSKPAASKKGS